MNTEELIEQMAKIIFKGPNLISWDASNIKAREILNSVLVPAGLGFIDENQELPLNPHDPQTIKIYKDGITKIENLNHKNWRVAQQDMIQAGFRRFVPLTKQGETKK